ncbi:MAG: hypothetical protein HYR94_10565 [Chloroflexi bacterium]|nr:hypothetical protein [Chloroflexota bacterium]
MKDEASPPSRLAEANTRFASNIVAALMLGDIEFVRHNISWLEVCWSITKLGLGGDKS